MYNPISDYGIIGDMHAAALVSKCGSIDYCSMPYIDSPTVFGRLLDDKKGGFFSIRPQGEFTAQQEYISDTNILKCEFKASGGKAELVDFMPVNEKSAQGRKVHSIHRCLQVKEGRIDFILECVPRPGYAVSIPMVEKTAGGFKVTGEKDTFTLGVVLSEYETIESTEGMIVVTFSLDKDAHFNFCYGDADAATLASCSFLETDTFWREWLHSCSGARCVYLGEYEKMVNRSTLALKLLTFQPTGAIAASVTTSLPEAIGAERNWDYRFSWLRDASFTLKAFFSLSHIDEASSYLHWLHSIYARSEGKDLQIMYSLRGQSKLDEKTLDYLEGYRASSPVRVGNAAYGQKQWDIYGEVMDAALRLSDYAGKIDMDLWSFLHDICELAAKDWHKPDSGIWEVRGGPYDFVYSKVMCWVALERGVKIARRYGFSAPVDSWIKEKDRIKQEVLSRGYDKRRGSFLQRYGATHLDSSSLLFPLLGFLPISDARIRKTIDSCKRDLMDKGFLKRYDADDSLSGEEGSFILCNFWFVECLALAGKMKEAKSLLKRTEEAANHLGLFSEEYDAKEKKMLGNFPQGFSHIGYINAAMAVLKAEHRRRRPKRIWITRAFMRVFPFRIVLNKKDTSLKVAPLDLANRLKILLGRLGGAFFDAEAGRVDYTAMKHSESFGNYLELASLLKSFDLKLLKNDSEKKAFWINIYNILVIHGVIELQVRRSVKEVFKFFQRIGYIVGGFYFTPDDIEHGIVRRNQRIPGTDKRIFSSSDPRRDFMLDECDPRIHFAFVCASSSCPPIEFYNAETIDEQLDIAAKSFMNRSGLSLDKGKSILYLSQIFKWYAKDFGKGEMEVIRYILQFTDEVKKQYILDNLQGIKVKYAAYNWQLNQAL